MANNYYQLYIDSVFSLAYTISVKFEQAADAINNKVMMEHGFSAVDKYDPASWRYYQNISGSYHFTNSSIQITSLDTLADIAFTKANLALHPATKAAYSHGSIYYNELVNKYPDDELLIRGILYPCDINTAITALDGTILAYPADLVDSNEYHFIEKLQDWIYDYLNRWVNKQYEIAHDLYVPMYMSQFYMHLIPAIINIRLQACKTPEAHSYHVRQYLASNLMLDEYLAYLTKEQALFFYRNIDYIKANAGKQEVFDWLVENVMTKRGLPIYGFDAKHDVSTIIATEDNDYTESDRPGVIFRRLPINYPTVDPKRNIYNTQEILDKINSQAVGNPEYHGYEAEDIERSFIDYRSSNTNTKLLESAITDYSQAVPYPLSDTLLNEWFNMSFTNRYNAFVTIEFPITKEETTLSVKDAFTLFVYCALKYRGIDTAVTTKIIASRVYKENQPTLQWLTDYFAGSTLTQSQLAGVFEYAPSTSAVGSINAFYSRAVEVFNLNLAHYYAESRLEHYITTGELKVANTQLFEDQLYDVLPAGVDYATWLNSYSYDFSDYEQLDYLNLATAIYGRATGSDANKKIGIKEIQKAMVSLFVKLSSYSIQVIDNADVSPLQLASDPGVKLGDVDAMIHQHLLVEVPRVTVIARHELDRVNHYIDSNDFYDVGFVSCVESDIVLVNGNTDTTVTSVQEPGDLVHVEFSPMHITGPDFEEDYEALSPEDKLLAFEYAL
jgi:hypothetical protein